MSIELKRKVVLLGDSGVGKTSLVRRFVYNMFNDKYIQTIGTKVSKKNVNINFENKEYEITLVIWDVLGQQGYTNVQNAAFKGSDGALFVCDVSSKSTLHSILHYWIPTLDTVAQVPGVLLANKIDLKNREVSDNDLEEFSKTVGLPYVLTSAKTGENVEEAFEKLSKLMLMFKSISVKGEKGKKEIKTLKDVLDFIIRDFCQQYGNWNDGMAVLEVNVRVLDMDMKKPTFPQLRLLIERLYRIEAYHLGTERAQKNKIKRIRILDLINK